MSEETYTLYKVSNGYTFVKDKEGKLKCSICYKKLEKAVCPTCVSIQKDKESKEEKIIKKVLKWIEDNHEEVCGECTFVVDDLRKYLGVASS